MGEFLSHASTEVLALYLIDAASLAIYFVWKLKSRGYLISPYMVPLFLFVFAVFIAGPLQYSTEAWRALGQTNVAAFVGFLNSAMALSLLGLLITILTLWLVEATKTNSFSPPGFVRVPSLSIGVVALVAMLGIVVFFGLLLMVGVVPLFGNRDVFDHHVAFRPAYKLALSAIQLSATILAVWSLLHRSSKFLVLILVAALAQFLTGTRGGFVALAQVILAIWIYLRGRSHIPRRTFGSLCGLALLGVVGMLVSSLRAGGVFDAPSAFEEMLYGNTFSDMRDGAFVLSGWSARFSGEHLGGKTYLAGMLGFLPSAISPLRQEWSWGYFSTTTLFGWTGHYGLRGGWYIESYLNFGIVGVVFVAILAGWILAKLERVFWHGMVRDEPQLDYWRAYGWSEVGAALFATIVVSSAATDLFSVIAILVIMWGMTKIGESVSRRSGAPLRIGAG